MSATLDDLRSSLMRPKATDVCSDAYVEKNLHEVPVGEVVDRLMLFEAGCAGQTVLHVGASGDAHVLLQKVAAKVYGWDLAPSHEDTLKIDLDEVGVTLPVHEGVTRIICGEVLEHLGNPQHFLTRLRAAYPGVWVVITVPNAFSSIARKWLEKGYENVNKDHVAWYSYTTLTTLVQRAGYRLHWWGWYNGQPGTAEGLIAVVE